MASKSPILSIENLAIGYGKPPNQNMIMDGLNLNLFSGQLVCFMGPNGVGKSTLIRTMIGAQPPLAGQLFINGQNTSDITIAEMARLVSVVLTDKINAGNMTAQELIAMGRYPHLGWSVSLSKSDIEVIDQSINQTNINALRNRKIYELSDGQLQKVMIARALCQDTPIMVLDEPTAHLDLNNRVEVINLLSDLAKSTNKAILMATHELDLALQSADRIWLAGPDEPIIDGFPEDLVLNGKIDEVFGLKGFDLKTGRLEKQLGKGEVSLIGDGHAFLWTKNALERYGYAVVDESEIVINIINDSNIAWQIKNKGEYTVNTLEELISLL
ncbi:ABC transporter ATP-binding protein [Fulvivirga lutimaris]|uniref:ABC transporter ATP-binding protein n=1 Tax=Fulvivirga lutimaris TaxID=1819566 RepID=UPI0012BBEAE7|nr:ABC transporter ATP-binding protein [Fulvivirga lutimaris]MTI40284.1 ABC transporter ATP-binding protein [Fulvivirga lutimaris]